MKIQKIFLVLLFILKNLFSQQIPLQPEGWVSDFAKIIDEDTKNKIESIIIEVEQKTSAEIAVVSIETTGDFSIEEFATRLFEKWKIGKREKDNGVLLIAAIKDRKVRIEVGYGLEGILPDGLCGEILDKYVTPYFKEGDYSKGFLYGTAAIAKVIAKDAGVELTGEIYQNIDLDRQNFLVVFFNTLIIILLILMFRYPFLGFWILTSGSFRGGSFGRGGFGGGFGGFGGGLSGGGGASRGW